MATQPSETTEPKTKTVAEMNATELHRHLCDRDTEHKAYMKHHRALLRCLPGGAALLGK